MALKSGPDLGRVNEYRLPQKRKKASKTRRENIYEVEPALCETPHLECNINACNWEIIDGFDSPGKHFWVWLSVQVDLGAGADGARAAVNQANIKRTRAAKANAANRRDLALDIRVDS